MQQVYVRDNNTNKPVRHIYVHINGQWVIVKAAWIKTNNVWVQVHTNI